MLVIEHCGLLVFPFLSATSLSTMKLKFNMKRIFSFFFSYLALWCCASFPSLAQTTRFNPAVNSDGITYALPRTHLHFHVQGIKTVFTPGEFARYAERYLHLHNIGTEAHTEYQLTSVSMEAQGVPDTTKIFSVRLKSKSVAPLATLSTDGLLLAVNTVAQMPVRTQPVLPAATSHRLNSKDYFTEEILAAISTAKMAELTAAEIYEIRESRNSIMRGQVEAMPKDGASLQIVLSQLNHQEAALLQLFTGYTDTIPIHQTYTVDPKGDIEKQVLFRFSKCLGFVDADDLAGTPYYIYIGDQHTVTLPTEKEMSKRKLDGIVYNLPSQATIRIFNAQKTVFTQTVPIPQFGTIDQLPASHFKDSSTQVLLHPVSGAIQAVRQ